MLPVARNQGWALILHTELRIDSAEHRFDFVNGAHAGVTVDTRANIIWAPLRQFVRKIWICKQLSPHHEVVVFAASDRVITDFEFNPARCNYGNGDHVLDGDCGSDIRI